MPPHAQLTTNFRPQDLPANKVKARLKFLDDMIASSSVPEDRKVNYRLEARQLRGLPPEATVEQIVAAVSGPALPLPGDA